MVIIATNNILSTEKTDNNYNNHPWPKYYSTDNKNKLTKFKTNKVGEKQIITSTNG